MPSYGACSTGCIATDLSNVGKCAFGDLSNGDTSLCGKCAGLCVNQTPTAIAACKNANDDLSKCDNAICTTDMSKIYTTDPGKTEANCSVQVPVTYTDFDSNDNPVTKTRQAYFRPFKKASASVLDSSTVTSQPTSFGGQTCSQQILPTSTKYPDTFLASTQEESPNHCTPEQCSGSYSGNPKCYFNSYTTPKTGKGDLYATWVRTGQAKYGGTCPDENASTRTNLLSSGVCTVASEDWPCTYSSTETIVQGPCQQDSYPVNDQFGDFDHVVYYGQPKTTYGKVKTYGPSTCPAYQTTRTNTCDVSTLPSYTNPCSACDLPDKRSDCAYGNNSQGDLSKCQCASLCKAQNPNDSGQCASCCSKCGNKDITSIVKCATTVGSFPTLAPYDIGQCTTDVCKSIQTRYGIQNNPNAVCSMSQYDQVIYTRYNCTPTMENIC